MDIRKYEKKDMGEPRLLMLAEDMGGVDALNDAILSQVAIGRGLIEVARAYGVTYKSIWNYLVSDEKLHGLYLEMQRGAAEYLAHESLEISDAADMEDYQLAKLRIETRLRLAKSWDKNKYGEGKGDAAGGGLTVVVQRGGSLTVVGGQDKGYPECIPAEEVI